MKKWNELSEQEQKKWAKRLDKRTTISVESATVCVGTSEGEHGAGKLEYLLWRNPIVEVYVDYTPDARECITIIPKYARLSGDDHHNIGIYDDDY